MQIPSSTALAVTAATQLQKLLSSPGFTLDNPEHLKAADSLWQGALLARRDAKRELSAFSTTNLSVTP